MLIELPPDAAEEMENLLHRQARSDQNFYSTHMTGDLMEVELLAATEAVSPYGAGGGRAKRIPATDPS